MARVTLNALAGECNARINSYLRRATLPFDIHMLDRELVVNDDPLSELW